MIERSPIPVFEQRTFADGRKALVCIQLNANASWWGAVSSGRRDVAFVASQSLTNPKDVEARFDVAFGSIANWVDERGEPYRFDKRYRSKVREIETTYADHPTVREFTAFCGLTTVRCVLRDSSPDLALKPLDEAIGFDTVERFYNRWPFLQDTFDGMLTWHDEWVEEAIRKKGGPEAAALAGWSAPSRTETIAAVVQAFAAERVEDAAASVVKAIEPFRPNDLDIGDGQSAARLMECWKGFRPPPVFYTSAMFIMANAVPADWLPKDAYMARYFCLVATSVARLTEWSKGELDARTLVSSSKGRWHEFYRRIRTKGRRAEADADHVQRAFLEQVMMPALCHAIVFPEGNGTPDEDLRHATLRWISSENTESLCFAAAWRILFTGKSLAALAENVRDWHRDMNAIEDGIGKKPDIDWATPFDRFASDGIAIVAIKDTRALRAEGAAMIHCVGGNSFAAACVGRTSVIASIRRLRVDGTEERLSTVELTGWTPGKAWRPVVKQHMGPRNEPPDETACRALEDMLSRLASKEHVAPIPLEKSQERSIADIIRARAGYDWMDAGRVENAIRQWAHFLPRDISNGGLAWFRGNLEAIFGDNIERIRRAAMVCPGTTRKIG